MSNPLKDMLLRLLDSNPESRISAKEALLHEWFQPLTTSANIFSDETENSNIRNEQFFPSVRRAIANG